MTALPEDAMRLFFPLTLIGTLLAACAGRNAPPPVPDRMDAYGSLEVVTHTRAYRAGDTGQTGQTRTWSLRWKGQPLSIDTRGGMFGDQPQRVSGANAVFVLGRGDTQELIVNVGDPNNTSAFHALRPQGDTLAMPLLCLSMAGDNEVGWLDAPATGAERPRRFNGPQYEVLDGGRYLQLGSRCLYDVRQRRVLRVPQAPDVTLWRAVPPLGLSPDGRSLVRFGAVDGVVAPSARTGGDEPVPHLLVADLEPITDWTAETGGAPRGRWQVLRIDDRRMRFADPQADLDAAWLAHHFEWRRGPDGRDRLVARTGFKPLPWRGRYGTSGGGEYIVPSAQQDLRPVLLPWLQSRFGAQPLPAKGTDERLTRMALRGETLAVNPLGLWVESAASYFPGKPGDPALQQSLVREIGAAFDAELATGRHDALFVRR